LTADTNYKEIKKDKVNPLSHIPININPPNPST
jgi:hypothetical protein